MISKLRKLRGRSWAEIAERARQNALILAERAGAGVDRNPPSDGSLVEMFNAVAPSDAAGLLDHFRSREIVFFPGVRDRNATLACLDETFPSERLRIPTTAREILADRFSLLGYPQLSFGGPVPDWHFDPVSGTHAPIRHWSRYDETDATETGDKKVIWELNRHQYFVCLGQAYWLTEDEIFARAFVSHLESWIQKNPPKMGLNWSSALEISFRSMSWIWGFHFFRDSPHFTPSIFLKMLRGLYLNARHIARHLSTFSSPNTHLTGEALGLYVIGTFLRELKEAENWKQTAYRILLDALRFQIRDDGGYVEQATHYQRYTADIYLSLAILRHAEGLELAEDHKLKLRLMLDYLMFLTQPNGETPLLGDDDGGRLYLLEERGFSDFRSTLAVGAAVLSEGRLKTVAGSASPELIWLIGPDGLDAFNSLESSPVQETRRAFESSGTYVVRDRWSSTSNYLVIDCGPHGFMNGGHAHADALGFVASFGGLPVFVDSGTYTYTGDRQARDQFRSSSAHNCLTVNGIGSAFPDGPFSWRSTPDSQVTEWSCEGEKVVFRGRHTGFQDLGVMYERSFLVEENGETTLIDRIVTKSLNNFEISFILSPEVEARIIEGSRVSLCTKDGKQELLTIVTKVTEQISEQPGSWTSEQIDISPRYGSLVATTRLVFSIARDREFQVENRFVSPA